MDDAAGVGGGEGVGDLTSDGKNLLERKRSARDLRVERFTRHQLHHEEIPARRAGGTKDFFERVDGGDSGMVQGRQRASLPFEARFSFFVFEEVSGQDLDGDVPSKPRVTGFPDLAHPSGPEETEHLVRAKTGPGGESHVGIAATILGSGACV